MWFRQRFILGAALFVLCWANQGLTEEITSEDIWQRANTSFAKIYAFDIQQDIAYVAADRGLYKSADRGKTWFPLPAAQLPLNKIEHILALKETGIFAATTDTIYHLKDNHWEQIHRFGETNPIKNMSAEDDTLLVITARGVTHFDSASSGTTDGGISSTKGICLFKNEPGIRQVQNWAIRYADVHPTKIARWREAARKRAWLPSLDVKVDGGRDWSFSDSIWGSSSGVHHIGPDDKSFGRDINFAVSFSWDLADLVWSGDETSIDNRSKLMVELREDILDQVTRLYFERRRLQMALRINENKRELSVQNHLRIDELTALIDGFTGGRFSAALHVQKLPEMVQTDEGGS